MSRGQATSLYKQPQEVTEIDCRHRHEKHRQRQNGTSGTQPIRASGTTEDTSTQKHKEDEPRLETDSKQTAG